MRDSLLPTLLKNDSHTSNLSKMSAKKRSFSLERRLFLWLVEVATVQLLMTKEERDRKLKGKDQKGAYPMENVSRTPLNKRQT